MLFAAAAIVTAEVLLRKGVGAILGTGFVFSGSDEISSFLFAVGTSWSMAYVLVTRGHVRIDALYIHFGPRTRALLDLFSLLVLGIFAAALLERSWDVAYTSYAEGIRYQFAATPAAGLGTAPMVRRHRAVLSGARARVPAFPRGACCAATMRRRRPSPAQSRRMRRSRASSRASAYNASNPGRGARDDRDHTAAAYHPAGAQRAGCGRDGRAGAGAQPVLRVDAAASRDGRDRLELVERVHSDRHPAVRDAGRDPAALGNRRARLQRHRPVAVVAARRPHARQHRIVRHVRGDLGLERRHRGDHRHRRDPRDQEAQLQRAAVPRHHRGRRHARHPHPAFDQLHPVRAADQLIGAAAVSRGLPAGLYARLVSSW